MPVRLYLRQNLCHCRGRKVKHQVKLAAASCSTRARTSKTDPHVTNWALSCFALFRRSAWRHTRKLSRALSELLSTSILSLYDQISKPTSMTRMFIDLYSCKQRRRVNEPGADANKQRPNSSFDRKQNVYLVDVIYNLEDAGFSLASKSLVLEGEKRQTRSDSRNVGNDRGEGFKCLRCLPQRCPPPQRARRTSVDSRQVWISEKDTQYNLHANALI